MSIYGNKRCWGYEPEYEIDLVTRRIYFQYAIPLGGGDFMGFNFDLLSECRSDIQIEIKQMLEEDGIKLQTVETETEFYTLAVSDTLPWESSEE